MKIAVLFGTRDLIVYKIDNNERFNLSNLNPTYSHNNDSCIVCINACNREKSALYETQERLKSNCNIIYSKANSAIAIIDDKYDFNQLIRDYRSKVYN